MRRVIGYRRVLSTVRLNCFPWYLLAILYIFCLIYIYVQVVIVHLSTIIV
jgi:hypothetical protein